MTPVRAAGLCALLTLAPGCGLEIAERFIGVSNGCPTTLEQSDRTITTDAGAIEMTRAAITLEHDRFDGCPAGVTVRLRPGPEQGCSLRISAHAPLTTILDGRILANDVSLQLADDCAGVPALVRGSYQPGVDFLATVRLDGALDGPDAPLSCWEGTLTVHLEGTLVQVDAEASGPETLTISPIDIDLPGQVQSTGTISHCFE